MVTGAEMLDLCHTRRTSDQSAESPVYHSLSCGGGAPFVSEAAAAF